MRQLEASARQCSGALKTLEEHILVLGAEEADLLEQRAAQERSATEHAARAANDAAQAECAVARSAALRRDAAASVTEHASVLLQMRITNAAKHALVTSELVLHDDEISAVGKHVAELQQDLDSGRAQQHQVIAMAKAQEAREAEMVRRVEVCVVCALLKFVLCPEGLLCVPRSLRRGRGQGDDGHWRDPAVHRGGERRRRNCCVTAAEEWRRQVAPRLERPYSP